MPTRNTILKIKKRISKILKKTFNNDCNHWDNEFKIENRKKKISIKKNGKILLTKNKVWKNPLFKNEFKNEIFPFLH